MVDTVGMHGLCVLMMSGCWLVICACHADARTVRPYAGLGILIDTRGGAVSPRPLDKWLYDWRLLGRIDAVTLQKGIHGGVFATEAAVEDGWILGASALKDIVTE